MLGRPTWGEGVSRSGTQGQARGLSCCAVLQSQAPSRSPGPRSWCVGTSWVTLHELHMVHLTGGQVPRG